MAAGIAILEKVFDMGDSLFVNLRARRPLQLRLKRLAPAQVDLAQQGIVTNL